MSAQNVVKNSRAISKIDDIVLDSTPLSIYTCPANCTAHMNLLFITNAGANASDIDVQWYRAADTKDYFILGGKNLATGEYIQFDGGAFIVLEAGDIIKVTTDNTAGAGIPRVDVFCTLEEFFNPLQA